MNYLLDTNIILIYSRDDAVASKIEKKYEIFSDANRLAVSLVSVGEIEASILKQGLGMGRTSKIRELLDRLTVFSIDFQEVVKAYAEIDAFSQGKLGEAKFSSRNMGKNDIWIAATAKVFDLTLITTDKDFDHLQDGQIHLEYIPLNDFR